MAHFNFGRGANESKTKKMIKEDKKNKGKKTKKAILFSIAALLLSLVIISLSFIIAEQYQKQNRQSEQIISEIHIYNLYNSIEYGLNKLMHNLGWRFKLNDTSVSITQTLPATNYNSNHTAYVNFVNNYTEANMSADTLLIVIEPNNVNYTNPTDSSIAILPTSSTNWYDLYAILTTSLPITSCSWSSMTSGNYPVHIFITDTSGNTCETTQNIDLGSENVYTVTAFFSSQAFSVNITKQAIIVEQTNVVSNSKINDTIGLNNPEKIIYKSDAINVTNINISINKNPRVYA